MSTQPRFLEKVLHSVSEGAIAVCGIITGTYVGSHYGLWSDEHAWIFTQGMLLLWGVWVVMGVVFAGLDRWLRPRSDPPVRREALHTRHVFENRRPFQKEQPFSKAKNGRRDW